MPNITTRFAPSPTGKLHIGGLRTALYNYLYARHHHGQFLLRIEDTDRARLVEGAAEDIVEHLQWASLQHDGEPFVQSQRLDRYRLIAKELVQQGGAYRCYCSAERLEQLRADQQAHKLAPRYDGHCRSLSPPASHAHVTAGAPAVVRLAVPRRGTLAFTDLIHGNIKVNAETLDDQVLFKSDGFPTYHLAAVVDDHDMAITHVIRGEEWLPSTPKHLLLYQTLGWTPPAFAHLPLLLNPDRSKLSKRRGDVAVADYRRQGYLPQALVNFIALLGWNPGTPQEIFSLAELVEHFSLERVKKSGAIFNQEKLDWLNGAYLRQLGGGEFTQLARPWLQAAGIDDGTNGQPFLQQVLALEQSRIRRLADLPEAVEYFFRRPAVGASLLPWKNQRPEDARTLIRSLAVILGDVPQRDFTTGNLKDRVERFIAERKVKPGEVFWPMRVALSGRRASPPPLEIAAVLGRAETLARLQAAAGTLTSAGQP